MAFTGWPVEAIEFFERLEDDNTKSFWNEQKHVYEEAVKAPMAALLTDLEKRYGAGKIFRPKWLDTNVGPSELGDGWG